MARGAPRPGSESNFLKMRLSLDHLVILVPDLERAMQAYGAMGFTVQPGGTHSEGSTHNALIGFADGSYIELIAFLKADPGHRWYRHQEVGQTGLIDYALVPDDIRLTLDATRAQTKVFNTGPYEGPFKGGRERPDGERLAWEIALPPGGDLPFLCADVTPRALRVREGDVRAHANGVQGIASITVLVADLAATLARLRTLLEPATSGTRPPAGGGRGAGAPAAAPTMSRANLSGLDLQVGTIMVGTCRIELVSPRPNAVSPPGQALAQALATHGEGPIAAALPRVGKAGEIQVLPRERTDGAWLDILST